MNQCDKILLLNLHQPRKSKKAKGMDSKDGGTSMVVEPIFLGFFSLLPLAFLLLPLIRFIAKRNDR